MTPQGLILSKKNKLYLIKNLEDFIEEEIGYIPWHGLNILGHSRTIDRIYKVSIQQALWVPKQGYLLYNHMGWWLLRYGKMQAEKLPTPNIGRPMGRSICRTVNNEILFAEYFPNAFRNSVKIYRTTNLFDYELAFEFPPLSVRHIHAIVQDPHKDYRQWVLTGDYDHESLFFFTEDNFKHLTPLPCLGQRTRATSICFDGNHQLVWGMDSPLTSSSILQWGPDYTKEPETMSTLPGPAYYMSTNVAGGMYIGTTVEPGPAVSTPYATIWAKTMNKTWCQIGQFKSDILPQYAIIYFPREILPENFIIFSLRATTEGEGTLIIARDLSLN